MHRRLRTSQWMRKLQRILQTKGISGLSNPCYDYFVMHKRHLYGGIMVLCFFSLIAPFAIISMSKRIQTLLPQGDFAEYKQWHEMSISNSVGSDVTVPTINGPYGHCIIQRPDNTKKPVQPVLVPTFPGGSADLMKFLIEATTGVWTGNGHDHRDIVAIKTHYPYYDKHVSVKLLNVKKTAGEILMRDPLDTMQVWHVYIENTLNNRKNEQAISTKNGLNGDIIILIKRWRSGYTFINIG